MPSKKLAEEDQHSALKQTRLVKQLSLSMGELHLDVDVDRMKREFKVEANVGALKYLTVRNIHFLSLRGFFKRQSGGKRSVW